MVEKIGRVSNPLTIIAIFAGIAEISGVVVLPLLTERNENIFIWYVMTFPILLVVIFYLTLWYKPNALYSPGDFRNDHSYMVANNIKVVESQSVDSTFLIG